MMMTYKEVWKT